MNGIQFRMKGIGTMKEVSIRLVPEMVRRIEDSLTLSCYKLKVYRTYVVSEYFAPLINCVTITETLGRDLHKKVKQC